MPDFFERLFGEEKEKTKYKESRDSKEFKQHLHESAEGNHDFIISDYK